jgi:hypothetical protein
VLAQQPSGYFVLNDILRYIDEDLEEEAEAGAAQPPAPEEVPATEESESKIYTPATEEPVQEKEPAALDTEAVTEKLEVAAVEPPAAAEVPAAEPAVDTRDATTI